MLKRTFLAVVVVAASAAAVAQTTTAGKPDIGKMSGKRGETPGFYAWSDCAAPAATIDGFVEGQGRPPNYKIWLHQKPPGQPKWSGDYVPEGEFRVFGEGGHMIRLFLVLSLKTFVAQASDVVDGVPQRLTVPRIATLMMAEAMPVKSPAGGLMTLAHCAGSAQTLPGEAWRKSF